MRPRLVALILALVSPSVSTAETLELIGTYDWRSESVIGFSGIEMTADGLGFLAVADEGWWVQGRVDRDGEAISEIKVTRIEAILGQDGFPVSARRVADWSDAEGLAIGADGQAWVSFERWAHVWRFDRPFQRANWIKDHETFYEFSENRQLEAVAIAPDGTVYVFSEQPLIDGFPIYRLGDDNLWNIDGYLPERDVFAIVGADFDQDGTLFLLERKLIVGLWWQNRVRRVRLDGSEDITLWTSGRDEFGNLEGISVWRDQNGLRLTLVSDNNGGRHPTQFVEFRLTE